MTDRRTLIAEYERREAEAGGLAHADPRAIVEDMAEEAGLTYAEVRDVLSAHWAGYMGAG